MLSWFREWSRSIASAALVSLVTLTISSSAPHPDDCHDAECGPATPHDPSGHGVNRRHESNREPIHCVLCHWTRSVRPTPETAPLFAPGVVEEVRTSLDTFSAHSQTSLARPSLRAPPASPSLPPSRHHWRAAADADLRPATPEPSQANPRPCERHHRRSTICD